MANAYESESEFKWSLSDASTTDSIELKDERLSGYIPHTVATMQAADLLINLSVVYLLKDEFHLKPAELTLFQMLYRLPWALKPLLAVASDATHWGVLSQRLYICVASSVSAACLVALGFIGHRSPYITCSLLFAHSLACAMCSAVGEGMVASSNETKKDICSFFAVRRLAFAITWYMSGLLILHFSRKQTFLLASIIPLSVFAAGLLHYEPGVPRTEQSIEDVLKYQRLRLQEVLQDSTVRGAATFMFAFMALPSSATPLFYFMTDRLRFSAETIGRLQSVQCIAALGGILWYAKFGHRVGIRALMLYSTLALTPLSLLSLVAVKRWDIQMGFPDELFLATDQMAIEMIAEIQFMPLLVLAARLCPKGLESTLFAFLLAVGNIGLAVSSVLSAGLMAGFAVSGKDFTGLPALIVLTSVSNLFILPLLSLIPVAVPSEEDTDVNTFFLD